MHTHKRPFNSNQQRRIHLLAIRAHELAERVSQGRLPFIDAVDFAYSAAQWSGLCDEIGDDNVQRILAAAFAGVKKGNP